jgi:hypothetical protein
MNQNKVDSFSALFDFSNIRSKEEFLYGYPVVSYFNY